MTMYRALLWVGLPVLLLLPLNSSHADDKDEPEPPSAWPKTIPAHRTRSLENLKIIGLAMHNFHDSMGAFPAAAITDKNGKALLSWRVMLLPYLEEDKLYKEFKLDEPWDSKHNIKLLEKIPKVYAQPISGKPAKPYTTYYQVFTGPGTIFDPKLSRAAGALALGSRLANITDGTSNTVLALEGAEAVPWTKPEDIKYDAKKAPKIGGLFKEGTNMVFGDGAVRRVGRKIDATSLHAIISAQGGEVVDVNSLPLPENR